MKRNIFISALALLAILFLTYCQVAKKELSDLADLKISLISPKGEAIASSITSLEKWAGNVFKQKFGIEKECSITDVQYYDVKQGFVAHIYYKTGDGKNLSYLLSNSRINLDNGTFEYTPQLETRDEGCSKWVISCGGGTCCTPQFNLQTNTASCPASIVMVV